MDNKVLVRAAVVKAMKALMAVTQTQSVLGCLQSSMNHTSWKVREQVLNTGIMVGICLFIQHFIRV